MKKESETAKVETFPATLITNNGCVDINATLEALRVDLEEKIAKDAELIVKVEMAVNSVFDTYSGKTILMDAILNIVGNKIDSDFSNFTEVRKVIRAFLRSSKKFTVAKGKGGGVTRL
jgi:hypothetical protein